MKKIVILVSIALVLGIVMGCPQPNDSGSGNGGTPDPTPAKVETPVITLLGSDVDVSQDVEITSATTDTSIYYTMDGTVPVAREEGTTMLYKSENKPTIALSATITAIAVKDGMTNSEVISERFTKILTMKAILGGEFARGGTDITVSSFYLGETEVTQAQWAAVMTGNQSPSYYDTDENLPVEMVSWYEAIEFCNALSVADELPEFYTVNGNTVTVEDWKAEGYRLPTEAEWEYAAGGGDSDARTIYAGTNTDGNDPLVDDLGDYAWYRENAGDRTHIVGTAGTSSTTPKSGNFNDLGLYDMSGNVREWCWDWYADSYDTSVTADPTGASSGSARVVRGGSWYNSSSYVRVANRYSNTPSYWRHNIGFRVARNAN